MNEKKICFIFARGGSKGVPKKNIVSIAGKPLIVHSINLAQSINEINAIYVSTDCQEIADIALKENVQVIKRPPELAKDNSPEWLSWQHAVSHIIEKEGCFDHFLSLPTTAPLRIKQDVECCMRALASNIDLVVTITQATKNPWFNIVKLDESSNIVPVLKTPGINRRQDAPACFDLTPVAYVTRPEFILENSSMWDGNVRGIEIPNERSIDIDTPMDFLIAKFLLEAKDNNIYL